MAYHIRKYRESDRDDVRRICHLTATAPAYVKNPELVATLYADYYTEFEPDGIFILARDEDDVAVGYILSSLDYKTFVNASILESFLTRGITYLVNVFTKVL